MAVGSDHPPQRSPAAGAGKRGDRGDDGGRVEQAHPAVGLSAATEPGRRGREEEWGSASVQSAGRLPQRSPAAGAGKSRQRARHLRNWA